MLSFQWQRHRRKYWPLAVVLMALFSDFIGLTHATFLTTYGEECTDDCIQRGFPYAWCHKKPSRNGTWIDRDYCSPSPGITRYYEPCISDCQRASGQPFFSCRTRPTMRGDWDYCSPFGSDTCAWSVWGPWSACSATCGSRSTRTRRRRMEAGDGKVRQCSGEIEQSIRSCQLPECPSAVTSTDCQWGEWTSWSPCSVSCGSGGFQRRSRRVRIAASPGGRECQGDDQQTIRCSADPCQELARGGETTTHPANPDRYYLGKLETHHHDVRGKVYGMGERQLAIEDFHYDGAGPDAFFWVGTHGNRPSSNGSIVPYPFTGEFFAPSSQFAPVLGRFMGEDIVLMLPPHIDVSDIKWISVWCRRFSISFGDLVIDENEVITDTTVSPIEFFPAEAETEATTLSTTITTSTATTTTATTTTTTTTTKSSTRRRFFFRTTTESTTTSETDKNSTVTISTTTTAPRRITTASLFSRRPFFTSRPNLPPRLPETPRSIESSRKIIQQELGNLKERQKDQADAQGEGKDPVPFTVIRVSSSVSQVRPEVKVKDDDEEEEEVKESTTTEEAEVKETTINPDGAQLDEQEEEEKDPASKLYEEIIRKKEEEKDPLRKLLDDLKARREKNRKQGLKIRKRPPFLRPIAKFPDIKIPLLEEETENDDDTDDSKDDTKEIEEEDQEEEPEKPETKKDSNVRKIISALKGRIRRPPFQFRRPTSSPIFRNPVTLKIRTASRSTTTEESEQTSSTTSFTRIPIREDNSIFVVRNTTTSVGEVTTPKVDVTSISSEDFRITTVIDEEPEEVTSTESSQTEVSSISSDDFRISGVSEETVTPAAETTPPATSLRSKSRFTLSSSSPLTTTTGSTNTPAATTVPISTTPESPSTTTSLRSRGESRFGGNIAALKALLAKKRKSFRNRFNNDNTDEEKADVEEVAETTKPVTPSSFISKFRSTTASFNLDEEQQKEEERAVEKDQRRRPFVNRFRVKSTARPSSTTSGSASDNLRTTRAPKITTISPPDLNSVSTVRISDDDRVKILSGFMQDDKNKNKVEKPRDDKKLITLDYPLEIDDNDADEIIDENDSDEKEGVVRTKTGVRKGIIVKVPKKVNWDPVKTNVQNSISRSTTKAPTSPPISSNEIPEEGTTEAFFITPVPLIIDNPALYNPCDVADACGPNARCIPRGSEPICSCPAGFTGIPREGKPDPAHGCVRKVDKCAPSSLGCPAEQACVRDFCLPKCTKDSQCALGERCVDGTCIKICFYDAHCLAGEFCDKSESSSATSNGVCLSGCRRDTNCPFGQICHNRTCVDGCHFNNDCDQLSACINGKCSDPCIGFDECGANAVCEPVSHAPTCKCPEGMRELNSPYVACVPENMSLARIKCIRDSDCERGQTCTDWQCVS